MTESVYNVALEIGEERQKQDARWGEQDHTPVEWMCILTEEVGEAAKDANGFQWAKSQIDLDASAENLRCELIQVAAVAIAAIECLDRGRNQ